MGRKLICLLLVCALAFSLAGCAAAEEMLGGALFIAMVILSDDRVGKDKIFSYVQENQDTLLTCIQEGDYSAFEDHAVIKGVHEDGDVVEFSCGGAGIGSGTTYRGFYYSAREDMTDGYGNITLEELVPSGDGYLWKEPGGDNTYYTEFICRYFYYYESSY